MKLRAEHVNILSAMNMFGGAVSVEMVTRAIHAHSYKRPEFYTNHRVYALIDQLQSINLVDATWPSTGTAVFTLTQEGCKCLNQLHH